MDRDWFTKIGIFGILKSFEWEEIMKIAREMKFTADEIIFSQGDEANKLYILKQGLVDIRIKTAPQLPDTLVSRNKENEVFGEFAFIASTPRSATAICTTDTTVVVIRKDEFERIVKKIPNIGLNFYRNPAYLLTEKLKKTNALLLDIIVRASGLEV